MSEQKYVYIAPKGVGAYVAHTDLNGMLQLDGIVFDSTKHLKVTLEEWYAANSKAHFENGKLVLGPDPADILKETKQKRATEIDDEITLLEAKIVRSSVAIADANLNQRTVDPKDAEFFNKYKSEIDALRDERKQLIIDIG